MTSSSKPGQRGLVVGIDHLPGLTDLSTRNLKSDGIEPSEDSGIEIVTGDGRKGKGRLSANVYELTTDLFE